MFDDFMASIAGNQVRVDLYGEIVNENRCVAMLTKAQAMQFSKELANLALRLPDAPQPKGKTHAKPVVVVPIVSLPRPVPQHGLVVRLPGKK